MFELEISGQYIIDRFSSGWSPKHCSSRKSDRVMTNASLYDDDSDGKTLGKHSRTSIKSRAKGVLGKKKSSEVSLGLIKNIGLRYVNGEMPTFFKYFINEK